jgi:uncharacterized membrane protein
MNTLKLVRVIAVGTAFLAGVISVFILMSTSTAFDMGITDGQFLVTVIVFLISTLYYLAIDAMIRRDEAVTEDARRIHQTTFNQAAVLLILSIIGTLSLVFL